MEEQRERNGEKRKEEDKEGRREGKKAGEVIERVLLGRGKESGHGRKETAGRAPFPLNASVKLANPVDTTGARLCL